MTKWSAEIIFLTLASMIVATASSGAPPICGVTIIQGEPVALDQPKLPARLSDATITTTSATASARSDVPVITSIASAEAVQQAVSIAAARYPKAKPVLVRSDPIAEKMALVSSKSEQLKDVPVIESAPVAGTSCN